MSNVTEKITTKSWSNTKSHMIVNTESGKSIAVPKEQWNGNENSELVTYEVMVKGEKFLAQRDSSRTKKEFGESALGISQGYKAPEGNEGDAPLYSKGDYVERTTDSVTFKALGMQPKSEIEKLEIEIKRAQLARELKLLAAA